MKLAEYLKQNGKTLTAFSRSIGLPVTTVHGWVKGRRSPGVASIVVIERATNGDVRVTDFLLDSAAPKPRRRRATRSQDEAPTSSGKAA